MNKKPILKELDKVVTDVIKDIACKNPSAFARTVKCGISVGDVVASKGSTGIDIFKNGVLLYGDIQNADAAQGIVNRLVSNRKLGDISDILKLEKDYVNRKNDLLFLKHAFVGMVNEDRDIRTHRIGIITQRIDNIEYKLSRYKNI